MRVAPTFALLVASSGCAASPLAEQGASDPLRPLNALVWGFNGILDTVFFRPAAGLYRFFLPPELRGAAQNFFANLVYPDTIVNGLLQGKGEQAGRDTARFLVNSTAGVLGLIDVGTRIGLAEHQEDFGQTLGAWGVGAGPYLVLPVLGPSSLREVPGVALTLTAFAAPFYVADVPRAALPAFIVSLVDQRSRVPGEFEERVRAADDKYAWVRDAYLQNRLFLVHDGNPPAEEYEQELEKLLEEAELLDELDDLEEP